MTRPGPTPQRPYRAARAARGLLAALVGGLLILAGIVVGAVPAAAQNAVGASTFAVANTVGPPAGIGAGQRLGNTSPQPAIVVATAVAAKTAAGAADDWPVISGIVRDAAKSKGNFGLGSGTASQAERAGQSWVGEGYQVAKDGTTLISRDGLRQFRPPSYKPSLDSWQANFEQRWVPEGQWQGNGHLDITDIP